MADRKGASSIVASLVVVLVAALVAWAGSQGGVTVGGVPVFALVVGLRSSCSGWPSSRPTCCRPSASTTSPAASHTSSVTCWPWC